MGNFSLIYDIAFGAILLVIAVLAFLTWSVAPRVSQRGRRLIRIFNLIGIICIVLLFATAVFIMPSM